MKERGQVNRNYVEVLLSIEELRALSERGQTGRDRDD